MRLFLYGDDMTFSAWFGTVPAVFWSAIFGSVLTLGGVVLLDRGNSKRQKQQLESAAEEAKRARAAAVRKDVYLKTALELTKGMERLGKLSYSDPTTSDFSSGFNDFYEAASQFQLVAELSTSLLMVKLVGEVNGIHLKAMARTPAIYSEKLSADNCGAERTKAGEKMDEIFDEQKELAKNGKSTSDQFQTLTRNLEFWKKVRDEQYEKQMLHLDQKSKLTFTAGEELIADLKLVGNFQMDLLVQMRRELGFESDVTLYRKTMKEAREKLDAGLKEVMGKITAQSE